GKLLKKKYVAFEKFKDEIVKFMPKPYRKRYMDELLGFHDPRVDWRAEYDLLCRFLINEKISA
ncbi:MAG: hypothetical protein AAFU03_18095, partial [Bacteroidota bacterium]